MAFWLLKLLHSWAALVAFIVLMALASEASAVLFHFEMETKARTSFDSVRSPKFLTKVVLWFFGS